MNPILWIDKNKFLTNLVEKVFKSKALPIYTLNQAKDFLYLIEDLNIQVIVLDAETVLDNAHEFKSIFETSDQLKQKNIIILGETTDLDYILNPTIIPKPIDPFQFADAMIERFRL